MQDNKNGREDFRGKYESKNPISKILLKNFFAKIQDISHNLKPDNVLEVACGAGFSTKEIQKIFNEAKIEASDSEEYLVTDAKMLNPDINISQESIYQLNRPDNSFSIVMALEVLEHLEKPEAALMEIKRVCKDYCIISVPNEPIWRLLNMARGSYIKQLGNTPGHINHWSTLAFKKLIEKHFKIMAVRTPLPWTIILAKKIK